MIAQRDRKSLIVLLILLGIMLSWITFVSLFNQPIQSEIDDRQDDIIPQHYQLEFIDQWDYIVCYETIWFQLTRDRSEFFMEKNIDHSMEISSIVLDQKSRSIAMEIQSTSNRIIIKNRQWRNRFGIGNYSISLMTHINISNTRKSSFIRQNWSSKYRILFTNHHFFPSFSHSFHRSTFHLNIITNDSIISNLPLNQTSSSYDPSQIAFALLHHYECRSISILQLCFPSSSLDFFSYIFNYTLTINGLFQSYLSRSFPWDKLTILTVLELPDQLISKPGLVFVDQNSLLVNSSAELILQQHRLIFSLFAYQWIDRDQRWMTNSLARTIANYLFHQMHDPMGNNYLPIDRFMSAVIIDSLCNTDRSVEIRSEDVLIEKGEAFLSEYRLYLGDQEFHSRVRHDWNMSLFSAWSMIPGHPIVFLNSSTMDMHSFKFDSNCSIPIPPVQLIGYRFLHNSSSVHYFPLSSNLSSNAIPINPFVHLFPSSWNRLMDELKSLRLPPSNLLSRLLFDSFLFNLANQLPIEYPLQIIHLFFFQQSFSTFTKDDLLIVQKILQWYRSMLPDTVEEKFVFYLRKLLHPFCANQLWAKQLFSNQKQTNQQIINEVFFELCCSVQHAICLQQISTRNDPQILLQFLFSNQRFESISTKLNQTDMLTSFNQLRIPSLFKHSDRIIVNLVCQTVRQQNDKYWYELIHSIEQIFQLIPSVIINGLACAIRTQEQIDYYLTNLCPPTPLKWPCYRNILLYSPVKIFDQLQMIDGEQWPRNSDELVEVFFQLGNSTSHSLIEEFQSIVVTWLTANQQEFLHWLDNQNAYLI